MCNQPGMPITNYQEGGEVRTGTIGGRDVAIARADEDIAGITELAYGLAREGSAPAATAGRV